jgi:hypothetical protein
VKKIFAIIIVMSLSSSSFALDSYQFKAQEPVKENVYGPGIHEDSTGRPFIYRTQENQQSIGPVDRDGYGFGVHKDQYGRPVYDSGWPKTGR